MAAESEAIASADAETRAAQKKVVVDEITRAATDRLEEWMEERKVIPRRDSATTLWGKAVGEAMAALQEEAEEKRLPADVDAGTVGEVLTRHSSENSFSRLLSSAVCPNDSRVKLRRYLNAPPKLALPSGPAPFAAMGAAHGGGGGVKKGIGDSAAVTGGRFSRLKQEVECVICMDDVKFSDTAVRCCCCRRRQRHTRTHAWRAVCAALLPRCRAPPSPALALADLPPPARFPPLAAARRRPPPRPTCRRACSTSVATTSASRVSIGSCAPSCTPRPR